MIQNIKLAIDRFISDPQFSHDEVYAGLVEVTDYVDGYVQIFEPRGANRDENGVGLPGPPNEVQ